MGATLGSLVVQIEANTARFASDMGKVSGIAEQAMKRVEQNSAMAASALKMVGGAMASAFAINGMAAYVAKVIESTASLKDLSEKTGATVENLSALRAVAGLGGRDMEAIGDAMVKLAKNLSGAGEETKGASQGIRDLGINLDKLKTLDSAERMKLIADKLITFADNAEKTALAVELFGKSGANILPYLKDLAETGDLVAKVTAKQAEEADNYEKNLNRLNAAADKFKKSIAMGMIEPLNDITTAMVAANKESGKLMALWVGLGGLMAKSTIGQMFNADGSADGINKAKEQAIEIKRLMDALDANDRLVKEGGPGAGRAAQRLDQIRARLTELSKEALKTTENLKNVVNNPFVDPAKPSLPGRPGTPPAAKAADPGKSFLEQLQRQLEQQQRGRFEMLRLEATQKGVSVAAEKYIGQLEEIERRNRRIDGVITQIAVDQARQQKMDQAHASGNEMYVAIMQQVEAFGMSDEALSKLTAKREIDRIIAKAWTDQTVDNIEALERLRKKITDDVMPALDELEKKKSDAAGSFDVGIQRAGAAYAKDAADKAKFAENLLNGALKRGEDALVNFAKTGKLHLGDLFSFMAEEFLRQQIRMAMSDTLLNKQTGGLLSWSTIGNNIAGWFGFGHANGLSYVPYDNYPAVLHQGERVLTKAEAQATGGSGGAPIVINNGPLHVGSNVSYADVAQAVKVGNARTVEHIRRLDRHGRFA